MLRAIPSHTLKRGLYSGCTNKQFLEFLLLILAILNSKKGHRIATFLAFSQWYAHYKCRSLQDMLLVTMIIALVPQCFHSSLGSWFEFWFNTWIFHIHTSGSSKIFLDALGPYVWKGCMSSYCDSRKINSDWNKSKEKQEEWLKTKIPQIGRQTMFKITVTFWQLRHITVACD